ncbi:hypothetical protein SADUNF_Sadunf02G0148000 [Salix dunnii]|uniref:GH16 domain-containing protein n=1 Tax=Salix dunnii TaxID=1413687 RepID=A0A835N8A4_9ROSI|nr:hypothetical protein SADUNF_Sadunf02G0148000 [Salix dunnii]
MQCPSLVVESDAVEAIRGVGKPAQIFHDDRAGYGFISQDICLSAYSSASIKLPADYSAVRSRNWMVQTNVNSNESTTSGSIPPKIFMHVTSKLIIFYVDGVLIREVQRVDAMEGVFRFNPMSLNATIWDGSDWATSGGKYKVVYKYMLLTLQNILYGCSVDPT